MSDLKKVCDLLKGGDDQVIVTIAGPIVQIEKASDIIKIAREHIGGIDWLVVELNGKWVHQG